jgi:hypothetical protein
LVTDLHAETVGDLLLFTLPADFGAALSRVPERPVIERDGLVRVLLELVDPARAAAAGRE